MALDLTVQQQIVKSHTLTGNCVMQYTEHDITLGDSPLLLFERTLDGNQTRSWTSISLRLLPIKHCTSSPNAPYQDTLSTGGELGWGKQLWLHKDSHYKLLHRTKFTMSLPPVPTDIINSIPSSCHLLQGC